MKKIKSTFLSERDANIAMDKIKSYCKNIKILYNENFYPKYFSDEYGYKYDYDYNFNGFGMISSFNLKFNNKLYDFENRYKNMVYNFENAVLEAEVANDNYDYVKEKLYLCGAVIVS